MTSEQLPKQFVKTAEILPIRKCGLNSFEEFKQTETELKLLDKLKSAGLSEEEIKLYRLKEAGNLDDSKIESSVLKRKLEKLYQKISDYQNPDEAGSSKQQEEISEPSKLDKLQNEPATFYPSNHPINELKQLEESLFGHLKQDILPITKRRKILRRFERKKQRILAQQNQLLPAGYSKDEPTVNRPGSLWDVKVIPQNKSLKDSRIGETHSIEARNEIESRIVNNEKPLEARERSIIGPKRQTLYTVKDNKIVRLEPKNDMEREEYKAVDIVVPVNAAEAQLLEGTKMALEDIMKIDRFKDYEPGIPCNVLYLKNIAPAVSEEQLRILFNQFVLDNGGPIDVRLLSGRMRGQAFVTFHNEDIAIRALEEINGTILSGKPIIAQFGRNRV